MQYASQVRCPASQRVFQQRVPSVTLLPVCAPPARFCRRPDLSNLISSKNIPGYRNIATQTSSPATSASQTSTNQQDDSRTACTHRFLIIAVIIFLIVIVVLILWLS
nr:uncharacterized protein LOC128677067 isoform X2 [Plodia interpunctella]